MPGQGGLKANFHSPQELQLPCTHPSLLPLGLRCFQGRCSNRAHSLIQWPQCEARGSCSANYLEEHTCS